MPSPRPLFRLRGPPTVVCLTVALSLLASGAGAASLTNSHGDPGDPGEEQAGSVYRVVAYCDYMPPPPGGHEGRRCGVSFKQVSRACGTSLPVNRCHYWQEETYCVGGGWWHQCFDHVWYHWSLGEGVLVNSPLVLDVCRNPETCLGVAVGDWDADATHKGCYYWIELEPPLDDVYYCDGHTPVGEPLGALGGGSGEA